MSQHKGLSTPQNKFLETIAARSDAIHANFVLGNAQRKYYPIVYCSDGFLLLTHYSRSNVMSRSSVCQFLWGPETTPTVRMEINQAFHNHYEYRNRIVFYTRIGEPFACDFAVTPIRNEKSQVVLFLCCYQEIRGDLLPPPIHQSASCFKLNHSKLYSVLSWASELPFSRSYLQMKTEGFDNDGKCRKRSRSKADISTVRTSIYCADRSFQCHESTSTAYASKPADKTYLNIPGSFHRTISSSLYGSQNLIKESRISVNRDSLDMSEELQIAGKAHYPTEYYLPSNCQTTFSLDTLSNSTRITSFRQVPVTYDSCIYRNSSILSLPQIKIQLKKFSQRKHKMKPPYGSKNRVVNTTTSAYMPSNQTSSSSANSWNINTTLDFNHVSNDPKEVNTKSDETNNKMVFVKNRDVALSSSNNNQLNIHLLGKEETKPIGIYQCQQSKLNYANPLKSAFKIYPDEERGQPTDNTSRQKDSRCFNCFEFISKHLTDNRSNRDENTSLEANGPDPQKYSYKRRKSLAFIHGLISGGRKIRDGNSAKLNRQIKNFSGKNVPEYKIQKLTKSNFVLLHYGFFRIVWDWLLLLLTFYIAFIVPYNVTFESHSTHSSRCRIIDLIVEIFLIIDVILNFHTTYVNKSGQIINDRHLIAKHYAKGWLILDLLAALPVDFILIFIQLTSITNLEDVYINSSTMETYNNTDKTNQTQLFTLFFKEQEHHDSKPVVKFNLISLLQMMKLARLSQYSVIVLGLLMFSFALVAHWCACIWYVIGVYEVDGSHIGWLEDLARRLKSPFDVNKSGGPSEGSKYFTALYFTCSSLTSVGFGNVSANTTNEKIFAICIMLLGALMHAAVFGNVTAIIQRIYARRTTFQSKVQDLKEFIEVHRIPKTLKNRMEDFFQTTWAINRGIDVPDVLKIYPEELQGDIYLHLNREVLGLKVFEKANRDCLKCLAINFKLTFCTPGEYLIHTGDILRRLYFVSNGSLEVLEKDEVVALLGKNDWFGAFIDSDTTVNNTSSMSTASFPIIRSRCDVKSLTYCDLHYIDLITLSEILNQHPRFKSELKSYLYEDLSFNIQEGAENCCSHDVVTVPAITLQLANDDKDWDKEETKPSVIEDVESLKPPPFVFDNKGRSCSLTSYDVESGLLAHNSRNRSNSEITTIQKKEQSSDKISPKRKFFIPKSAKSSGCSSNMDLSQKSVDNKPASLCTKVVQPTITQNDNLSNSPFLNDTKTVKPEQNRRHTVPTVQTQNSPLKSTSYGGVNKHHENHCNSDYNTDDTWFYSNHSSSSHSNDEFCFPYIRSTQCLSKNCCIDNKSLLSGQCLSNPNFSIGVHEKSNVNISKFLENEIPHFVFKKPVCETVQRPQVKSCSYDMNTISTSNLCLYTSNTSPVNSIWSCTNEYNHNSNFNRFSSPNRVNLHGSSMHDMNIINELRGLNNRLEYIELQFGKLFKLLESKQFL
ncbi:unnamed protein product [Heterobilharzia americana]|nr:unnamed protein product [Heterobilharzia americana]